MIYHPELERSARRVALMIALTKDNTGISLVNGNVDIWANKYIKLFSRMIKQIDEHWSKWDFTRWLNDGVTEEEFLKWLGIQLVEYQNVESHVTLAYKQINNIAYELDWEVNDPTRVYYNLSVSQVMYILQNIRHPLVFPTPHSILVYKDKGSEVEKWVKKL